MNRGLYFVVGALVVAVAVLGYFMLGGGMGGGDGEKDVNIKLEAPAKE